MNPREMLNILNNFNEGCELTDVTEALLSAAIILYGINYTTKADIIVLTTKELIENHIEWVINEGTRQDFDNIDCDVFKLIKGIDKSKYNFRIKV